MKSPAFGSAFLPLLDGPTSPNGGEDVAPPGSSPDLVCERHSHFGRQSTSRFNEAQNSTPDMQRGRVDYQQKEISNHSEPTGELPRPTDQYGDQDGGASACEIEQGTEDNEGVPAEEEIITGPYFWSGWDPAGPAEGQCGTAWSGELHHEGRCLDATWRSGVEGLRSVLAETGKGWPRILSRLRMTASSAPLGISILKSIFLG